MFFENREVKRARRAKKILDIFNLSREKREQIASTLARECLATDFKLQDKYSKAEFLHKNSPVLSQLRDMIMEEEGYLLERKGVDNGKRNENK